MSPPFSPFAALPPELVIKILADLHLSDLLTCRTVSRLFYDNIEMSLLLQYHMELARSGMLDVPSADFTTARRFSRLKELQQSWSTLDWRKIHTYTLTGELATYDLQAGIFTMGSTTTPWEEGGRTRVLGFTQLPGRDNDIKQWTIDDLGFEIQDFTTDPVQDLLAIIEDRRVSDDSSKDRFFIHIRTLSSGSPHPLANSPVLTLPSVDRSRYRFTIQSHGHLLGLLLTESSLFAGFAMETGNGDDQKDTFIIWDWVEGVVQAKLVGHGRYFHTAFSFLSSNTFILPTNTLSPTGLCMPNLDIYSFPSVPGASSPASSSSNSDDAMDEDREVPTPSLLASYHLPLLKPPPIIPGLYVHTTCRTDPVSLPHHAPYSFPSSPTSSSSPHPTTYPLPFGPNPDERILVFSVDIPLFSDEPAIVGWRRLVFVTHSSTLLSYLPPASRRTLQLHIEGILPDIIQKGSYDPAVDGIDIPWEHWGPKSTRWFEDLPYPHWVCYVHGSRFVTAVALEDEDEDEDDMVLGHVNENDAVGAEDPWRIRVLDFNPFTPSSSPPPTPPSEDGETPLPSPRNRKIYVKHQTTISHEGVFEEDIVSSLPYTDVISKECYKDGDNGCLMMDGERVVLLTEVADRKWELTVCCV